MPMRGPRSEHGRALAPHTVRHLPLTVVPLSHHRATACILAAVRAPRRAVRCHLPCGPGVLLLVVLAACCCCCCCCCKRLRRQRRDDAEMTIVNTIVAHNVAVNPRLNSTDQKARRAQNVLSTTSAGYIDIVDPGDDAPELRGTPMEAIDPDLDVVKSTENLRHLNKARPKGPPKRRAPTRVGAAMRAQRSVTPTRRIVRPSIKILPVVEDSTTDASPDTTANPHRVAQAKARARARAKDVKKAASAASAASAWLHSPPPPPARLLRAGARLVSWPTVCAVDAADVQKCTRAGAKVHGHHRPGLCLGLPGWRPARASPPPHPPPVVPALGCLTDPP